MTPSAHAIVVNNVAHAEPHALFDLVHARSDVGGVATQIPEIGACDRQERGCQFDEYATWRLVSHGDVEVDLVLCCGIVHGEDLVVGGGEGGDVAVVVAALEVAAAAVGAIFLEPAVASGAAGAGAHLARCGESDGMIGGEAAEEAVHGACSGCCLVVVMGDDGVPRVEINLKVRNHGVAMYVIHSYQEYVWSR